jgi:hypothetical protein
MVAMNLAEFVPGDPSKPKEERHRGKLQIRFQVAPGCEVRILQNIGRIYASLEPLIQAESHHSAEPLASFGDELFPAFGISLGGAPHPLIVLFRAL